MWCHCVSIMKIVKYCSSIYFDIYIYIYIYTYIYIYICIYIYTYIYIYIYIYIIHIHKCLHCYISYTFFSFLLSPLFSGKLSKVTRLLWSNISREPVSINKKCSKTKYVGFWDQSLVSQKAFMLLLIISSMLIL